MTRNTLKVQFVTGQFLQKVNCETEIYLRAKIIVEKLSYNYNSERLEALELR